MGEPPLRKETSDVGESDPQFGRWFLYIQIFHLLLDTRCHSPESSHRRFSSFQQNHRRKLAYTIPNNCYLFTAQTFAQSERRVIVIPCKSRAIAGHRSIALRPRILSIGGKARS